MDHWAENSGEWRNGVRLFFSREIRVLQAQGQGEWEMETPNRLQGRLLADVVFCGT